MRDTVGDDGLLGVAVEGALRNALLRELERVIERLGSWVDRVERLLDGDVLGERVVVRSPIRLPIDRDREGVSERDVLGVDGVGAERVIRVEVLLLAGVLVFVFVRVDALRFDPKDRCNAVIRLRELLRVDRLVFGVTVRTEGV